MRQITPRWIGQILRRKLGPKTEKRHGSYAIAASEGLKLARLFEKYGIDAGPVKLGGSVNSKSEISALRAGSKPALLAQAIGATTNGLVQPIPLLV